MVSDLKVENDKLDTSAILSLQIKIVLAFNFTKLHLLNLKRLEQDIDFCKRNFL